MKELEATLAELSRGSSDELAVAREEATRLRQALTATKARVLGLRDSLTAVAEEIDLSLSHGQSEQETTSLAPAISVNGVALLPEAESDGHGMSGGARAHDLAEGATITPIQLQEGPQDATEQEHDGLFDHARHEHGSNSCGPFSIEDGNIVNLAVPAPTRDLQTQGTDYSRCDYLQWSSTLGIESGTKTFPTLLPADTPEEPSEVSTLALPFPPGVIKFPSVFSAHIGIIEFFARKSSAYAHRTEVGGAEAYVRPGLPSTRADENRFSKLITTMVNMFVTTCWPDMCIWWTYIQSSMVVEKLMRWNLDSCVDTYKSLPVTHRPTALQVCTAHPPIIDWAFFPSVRDRMIELYSNSWLLDELVCELVHAYVVEADLSSLVTGLETLPPQKGYFRMWDIVQTISNDMQRRSPNAQRSASSWINDIGPDDDLFSEPTDLFELGYIDSEIPWTKMPLEKIYQSPRAAWKLFKLLRMEDRRAVKIDPVFAAAHPELCDDSSIVAKGIDCTLRDSSIRVPRPKPLTREAIINYKMIICNS